MNILLSEKEVIKAISEFYRVDEKYITTDGEGNYDISLPDNTQIVITILKEVSNGKGK